MIQELHKEYMSVSVEHTDNSKCLDLVSGAGFKKITDKAIAKFNLAYPSSMYEHLNSSKQITRSVVGEGVGRVVLTVDVKAIERKESSFTIEVKAQDLSDDDAMFVELYIFGDVDAEEFLKAIAVTRAMDQFKSIKNTYPEAKARLKRVKVKFASAHRYNIEVTFTELPE